MFRKQELFAFTVYNATRHQFFDHEWKLNKTKFSIASLVIGSEAARVHLYIFVFPPSLLKIHAVYCIRSASISQETA